MQRPRKSHKDQVMDAFRWTVKSSIQDWKKSHYKRGLKCPVLDIVLTCKNVEVDHHVKPFVQLVDEFLALKDITLDRVALGFDHIHRRYIIKDPHLRYHWELFHDENAILRLVSSKGNKQLGDLGYRRRKREAQAASFRERSPLEIVEGIFPEETTPFHLCTNDQVNSEVDHVIPFIRIRLTGISS
jgi:hypothetical protein